MAHRFQIDIGGLIDLLSHHLYSSPDVFLRELLQNAVDARTALRLAELENDRAADIRVAALGDGEIVFADDGIGLSADEVHRFLATIGQSSKRLSESPGARDFLGQFGIGLLACFVVSEEIEVYTRSAHQLDGPVLHWRGLADGTYELSEIADATGTIADDLGHGTRVRLRAKSGQASQFTPERVRAGLRRYGALLPYAITLDTPMGSERIDVPPPWRRDFPRASARRAAIMAYGRQIFGVDFFDFIPLSSQVGQVDGVAFVAPSATVTANRRADLVYLKGMLLSDQAENLLPGWAFFVKAVLDVHDLRPLASREAFAEDDALIAARATLGECIKDYLLDLSRTDLDRLHALIALHHQPIKQLAVADPEFLAIFWRWLRFETSSGVMTLEDYLKRHGVLRVARTVDGFRQIAPVVAAQGQCVINAGYVHEMPILEQLAAMDDAPDLLEIDALSLADDFADLTLDEREGVFPLVRAADIVLQPYRCSAQIKRFAPRSLPALYNAAAEAFFLRDLERSREVARDTSNGVWSAMLDDLAGDRGRSPYARLTLNYDNPMIRRLAALDDVELQRRLIEVLYVQTLLLGHHPLSAAEMNLVSESLSGLMEWSLDRSGRVLN